MIRTHLIRHLAVAVVLVAGLAVVGVAGAGSSPVPSPRSADAGALGATTMPAKRKIAHSKRPSVKLNVKKNAAKRLRAFVTFSDGNRAYGGASCEGTRLRLDAAAFPETAFRFWIYNHQSARYVLTTPWRWVNGITAWTLPWSALGLGPGTFTLVAEVGRYMGGLWNHGFEYYAPMTVRTSPNGDLFCLRTI